jgi:hypothetical protein
MILYAEPLRVVSTIPGSSTSGDDDRLVAEDGSIWAPVSPFEVDSTALAITRTLEDGYLK